MKDSKLINLLKKLNPDEFREFEKFTGSPFFSKGRDLLPFYKILKNFYPDFSDENLNNEFLFQKLYPGNKSDKIKSTNLIKTLSSQLFLLCKDFLIQLELKNDDQRKQYYLLTQLRKKKLYKEFEKDFKNPEFSLNAVNKGSTLDFTEKYLLESVYRDYSLERDNFENAYEANLKASEYTLLTGLINVFKHQDEINVAKGYNLEVRKNFLGYMLDSSDFDKFYEAVKENNHPFYHFTETYYFLYKMNKFPENQDYYFKLKEILQKQSGLFCQTENYILWNSMLSYCNINNLNLEEHFFIYNHIIDNGFYKKSANEDFHIVLFRNIVIVSSILGKVEWLEKFVLTYSSEIHIDHRNDMHNYSLAALNFIKGNFTEALLNIQKIRYEFFLYKIDLRILQLKIYYKLEYYEQIYSVIDSTLHFLNTHKEFRAEFKDSIKNLIKYLKEIIKLKVNRNSTKTDTEYLIKNISDEIYLGQKNWLLSEAGLLMG